MVRVVLAIYTLEEMEGNQQPLSCKKDLAIVVREGNCATQNYPSNLKHI
jgi:hypothetical protein